MAVINIASGSIGEEYHGGEASLKMRIYCRRTFTSSDFEAIVKGAVGSDLFYKEVACTVSAGVITHAGFTIDSTEDGSPNDSHYYFALYTNEGEARGDVYKRIIVPATPTDATLGALAIYSNLPVVALAANYYQAIITYINTAIAALTNMATKASTSVYGAVKISFAPALSNQPVAVSDNDPIIRAKRKTIHLETYGHDQSGLTAALAAISTTVCELLVTSSVTVSSNTIIPANILLTLAGDGKFSVNVSRTLTINNLNPPGPKKQVFTGAGSTVVKLPVIHIGWWAGTASSSNDQHTFTQLVASATANAGGTVDLGLGPWYCNTVLWPAFTRVIGHGNAVDGFDSAEGTIICPPADVQALNDAGLTGASIPDVDRYVFGVYQGFRMVSFENLCLSSGTSGFITPFMAYGASSGDSGLCLLLDNVTFDGADAPTGSVPRMNIHSTDVGEWECGSVVFDHCWMTVPPNSHGLEINTVNMSLFVSAGEYEGGTGSVGIFADNIGYYEVNAEFRGTLTNREDVDLVGRTQTNTIITNNGAGNNWLDIVGGGQFQESDIGQKVVRNSQTFYITGIVFITATGLVSRANLNEEIAPDATQRNSVIKTASPNTLQSYAGLQIDGSHTSGTMRGCVSEGFEYLAVLAGGQLEGPHNFDGCWIQDRILVNGSCNIAFRGNHIFSQTLVEGNSGALVRVTSHGDTISKTTKNYFNGVVSPSPISLDEPQIWSNRVGVTSFIQTQDSFPEGQLVSRDEVPRAIHDRSTSGTAGTIPILEVGTAKLTGSGTPQSLIRVGRVNAVRKNFLDYYYDQGYVYSSGRLLHTSNVHAGYKEWQWDGIVEAKAFKVTPPDADPAQITGDLDDYNPWISSVVVKLLNLTSDAWHNITGLALPADPAVTGFALGSRLGLEIELTYSGSFGVVLKYNSTSSLAANRFQTDDQTDLAVMAGDIIKLRRISTGWLVSRNSRVDKLVQLAAIQTFNNTSTLAVTNLSQRVGPGSYAIEVALQTISAVKGLKADIAGGTGTVTSLKGQWVGTGTSSLAATASAALNTSFGDAVLDAVTGKLEFHGAFVVNAPGTIIVRGAQRTADVSDTSILPGSWMRIMPARPV